MEGYPSEKREINQGISPGGVVYQPQVYPQPLGYAQPVMASQIPVNGIIVVNQSVPTIVVGTPHLGTYPVSCTCPFCKLPGTTVVEKSFSCGACCLCCCTGLLIYLCIQACNGKDFCCCDATHKCPNCGGIIGQYAAC